MIHGDFTSIQETQQQDPFTLQNKKLLKVFLHYGPIKARQGSMVAYQGDATFEHQGSGGASKWLKQKMTGEGGPLMTATWFPVLVGSIAFAGPSGMQQMWYSLWLRDKGAGMGAHLPKIRGLTHAAEEETVPSRGFMFDTESAREQKKWKDWQVHGTVQ